MTLPTLFVSHGPPTFALEPGKAGPLLADLGKRLPRPKAVLVVSPHWMTRDVQITGSLRPSTVHDFGGFPAPLYEIEYPAPGHPELAARAAELLKAAGWNPSLNAQRGLDHGAWVPLIYLFPQADIPVFQVSMPIDLDCASALEFGAALSPLADEGVLIIGSGSLTHNLSEFRGNSSAEASYVGEFVAWIRQAVQSSDRGKIAQALAQAPHAHRAHPSSDHFLPLPFAFGAAQKNQAVTILPGGIVHAVLSMESYVFGQIPAALN